MKAAAGSARRSGPKIRRITRQALALGKAACDQRRAPGLSVAELAQRAGMAADEIECIKEGGIEPTIVPLRHLAAAWTLTCT